MGHANIGNDLRDRVAELVAAGRKGEGVWTEVQERDYRVADEIIALVGAEKPVPADVLAADQAEYEFPPRIVPWSGLADTDDEETAADAP